MKRIALLLLIAGGGAMAAPVVYNIDGSHTYPRFEYNHYGYSTQVCRFNQTSGKITLDREAKTGSMTITVHAKSVDTGNKLFDEIIQEKDFFDTAKYPVLTFTSYRLRFDGDKPSEIDGALEIKGVAKLVTLKVTSFNCAPHPMARREACGADATAKVKRSAFGMGKFAPDVSDDVTLSISVEAIKE